VALACVRACALPSPRVAKVTGTCVGPIRPRIASREHRRQKKLEKHRTKRAAAKKQAARRRATAAPSLAALVRAGADSPFGPCWVSSNLHDDRSPVPSLVTVVVTRRLPDGRLLPHVALVDRTCLCVKDAFVMAPANDAETEYRVGTIGERGDALERCEPLVAQSVVYQALDYARSLGFEPQRDFQASLFGPRPSELLDTPLARPERPYYVAGPDDDAARVLRQLEAVGGPNSFEYVVVEE
jgi:hypothetical protein